MFDTPTGAKTDEPARDPDALEGLSFLAFSCQTAAWFISGPSTHCRQETTCPAAEPIAEGADNNRYYHPPANRSSPVAADLTEHSPLPPSAADCKVHRESFSIGDAPAHRRSRSRVRTHDHV